jgi:hypothetical protein
LETQYHQLMTDTPTKTQAKVPLAMTKTKPAPARRQVIKGAFGPFIGA